MKMLYIEGAISAIKFRDDSIETIKEIINFLKVDEVKINFKNHFIVIDNKVAHIGDYLVRIEDGNIEVWSAQLLRDYIQVFNSNCYLRNRII